MDGALLKTRGHVNKRGAIFRPCSFPSRFRGSSEKGEPRGCAAPPVHAQCRQGWWHRQCYIPWRFCIALNGSDRCHVTAVSQSQPSLCLNLSNSREGSAAPRCLCLPEAPCPAPWRLRGPRSPYRDTPSAPALLGGSPARRGAPRPTSPPAPAAYMDAEKGSDSRGARVKPWRTGNAGPLARVDGPEPACPWPPPAAGPRRRPCALWSSAWDTGSVAVGPWSRGTSRTPGSANHSPLKDCACRLWESILGCLTPGR
ncbi:uncharacterized protein [Pleurodeles waltl]|uniref:uncharacterized protein n=1 Tax=Pleurodeles waltl TaxID=8319 RepID=UPI0037096378